MNDTEFRAVLDWRMISDPWNDDVPREVIDDWLERESQQRGHQSFALLDDIIDQAHEGCFAEHECPAMFACNYIYAQTSAPADPRGESHEA